MKIERLTLEPVSYDWRSALETSRGTLPPRSGWVVRVSDAEGHRGCGEALPLVAAGTEDAARCEAALREASETLPAERGTLPGLLDAIDARWLDTPAARCALDVALHDLAARRAGLPLATLLTRAPSAWVAVNALLPIADVDTTVEAARRFAERGFRTFKLKVGADPALAVASTNALRDALPASARLRLDPNAAWSEDEARATLPELARLRVELVEQPVADAEGLGRLHADAPLDLAADEVLATPAGRDALRRGGLASIAVLKPMALGGLRAASRLARDAARVGVRCFVTTTLDGPIGTAAALHLAAAIGDATLACGLDAADALDAPFPESLRVRDGALRLGDAPGLGEASDA